jgi:DNA repair protein SbcD/Mre11
MVPSPGSSPPLKRTGSQAKSAGSGQTSEKPCRFKVLLFADTHLGFDLPLRPRVVRRRRGFDFLANYRRVLEAARREQVDCVVHGGDLFHRSRVHQQLALQAFEPLIEIADLGIPVFLVPGNHERSRIPFPLLSAHPNLHIFDRPRTVVLEKSNVRFAFQGFPQLRRFARDEFPRACTEASDPSTRPDVTFLCVHQTFEGATVGPSEYVFRRGPDVVPGRAIPHGLTAVLSGHIHRAQILFRDLRGTDFPAPVVYPGSIERTSFAEQNEPKGFLTFSVRLDCNPPRPADLKFHDLPARPMYRLVLSGTSDWKASLAEGLAALPEDSVVQVVPADRSICDDGSLSDELKQAPPTMNVAISMLGGRSTRVRDETSDPLRKTTAVGETLPFG